MEPSGFVRNLKCRVRLKTPASRCLCGQAGNGVGGYAEGVGQVVVNVGEVGDGMGWG